MTRRRFGSRSSRRSASWADDEEPATTRSAPSSEATDRELQVAASQAAELARVGEDLQGAEHDDAGSRTCERRDIDGVQGDVRADATEGVSVGGVLVEDPDGASADGGAKRMDQDIGATGEFVEHGKGGAEDVPG